MITKRFICMALKAALCAGTAALIGCSQQPASPQTAPASAASIAPADTTAQTQAPAPYTPPTADQLYQMVAPIALFPDKLVAQVLAGSTYPDQVTAADNYVAQNQNLQGGALQDQVNQQSWDPSVKGLTVFPKVLDQMAQNIPWTTSLGEAYVNDPTDVLNAIQVMRQRASKHGSLANSAQLRVVEQPVAQVDNDNAPAGGYPPVYSGPDVVPAPEQAIEILPAQPDTVYVPQYDPQTVYGEEQPAYPGYRYEQPRYSTGDVVATGAIAFGVGIVVASLFEHSHHDDRPSYGWNSWGMNWGDGRGNDGGDRGSYRERGQRPAVVHNNTTYVSNSTTIVNRYVTNNTTNNINNSVRTINSNNNNDNTNTSTSVHNDKNPRNLAVPAAAAAAAAAAVAARRAELARSQAHIVQRPTTAPDFHGALTKGEPARFARPATPAPVPPHALVPREKAHATSNLIPMAHVEPHPVAATHPGITPTPIERARARVAQHSMPALHPVAPASEHIAPTRPRVAQHSMPALHPGSAANEHIAPVRARPERAVANPSRSPQPVERTAPLHRPAAVPTRAPPRAQPEVEHHAMPARPKAAPAPHEAPRAQIVRHEPARPVAAPRKAVPKDALHPDKKDDQGH